MLLMTFASSVHNPKIMLRMLVKVLCGDPIATRRRLPPKGNVAFEDLTSGVADFDVRTIVGSEEARSIALALASVRRSNWACSFPAPSFHEDAGR